MANDQLNRDIGSLTARVDGHDGLIEKGFDEIKTMMKDHKDEMMEELKEHCTESEIKEAAQDKKITSNRDFIKGACAFGGGVAFVFGIIWAVGKLAISKFM